MSNRDYKKNPPNPTGKGGFGERPEDIAKGRWSGETSISYQYNKLIRMSVDDFKKWLEDHPEGERTVAQELAYQAILSAKKELPYLKEITDRTEGKPQQKIDHTTKGEQFQPCPILGGASVHNDDSDQETPETEK